MRTPSLAALAALAVVLACQSAAVAADVTPSVTPAPTPTEQETQASKAQQLKQLDIRKLLVLTGSDNIGLQVLQQVISVVQKQNPKATEQQLRDSLAGVNPNDVLDQVVLAYDRSLSHEDIRVAIAFYESTSGRRFVAAMPQISAESAQIGQQWGEELVKKMQSKLPAPEKDEKSGGTDGTGTVPPKEDKPLGK